MIKNPTNKPVLTISVFNFINLLFVVFFSKNIYALDSTKSLNQNVHEVWQIEEGLPQNSIQAITQTKKGYIWLGTQEGVVRFDGVNFTVFDKQNTPELTNNNIWALLEDKKGNLWIGTNGGGLNLYKDGKFTTYSTKDGLSSNRVSALYKDREDNL